MRNGETKNPNHDYHNPDRHLFPRQRGLSGLAFPVDAGGEVSVKKTISTVKEFIEELSQYPPDARFSIYYGEHDSWGDWENRFDDPTIIELDQSHITVVVDDEHGFGEAHARKYFSEIQKGNIEQ